MLGTDCDTCLTGFTKVDGKCMANNCKYGQQFCEECDSGFQKYRLYCRTKYCTTYNENECDVCDDGYTTTDNVQCKPSNCDEYTDDFSYCERCSTDYHLVNGFC